MCMCMDCMSCANELSVTLKCQSREKIFKFWFLNKSCQVLWGVGGSLVFFRIILHRRKRAWRNNKTGVIETTLQIYNFAKYFDVCQSLDFGRGKKSSNFRRRQAALFTTPIFYLFVQLILDCLDTSNNSYLAMDKRLSTYFENKKVKRFGGFLLIM